MNMGKQVGQVQALEEFYGKLSPELEPLYKNLLSPLTEDRVTYLNNITLGMMMTSFPNVLNSVMPLFSLFA